MAEERKSILLRIPPTLWEEIARLAERDLRSINAQIEFLLREAIRQRGNKPETTDAPGTHAETETETGPGTATETDT